MESPIEMMVLGQIHAAARRDANWIMFYGILLIVGGVPNIIFFGLGILNIWLGVLLVQASTAVKKEGIAGLRTYVAKIGLFFRITAIMVIVLVALMLIGIAVVVAIVVARAKGLST